MLNSLSEETQLIVLVIGIAILFAAVMWNSGRNRKKLYGRRKRDFRKNVADKVKQRGEKEERK